jgi:hypothetical protein
MTWMLWIAAICVSAACLAVVAARLMRSPPPRRVFRRRPLPRPAC